MNQKITIKTEAGEISYFIFDPDQAIDQQLAILHGGEIGHGITYRLTETQVQMVDYFCDSVIGATKSCQLRIRMKLFHCGGIQSKHKQTAPKWVPFSF